MRTALLVVVLVTAALFVAGCGQPEQGQDTETSEETTVEETTAEETAAEETTANETTAKETTAKETTAKETIVEETARQETTTAAASDSEQVAEVEAAPPAQVAPLPPSNVESHPPEGHMPPQELGVNEAGQNVSNTPAISPANSTIVFFPGGNGVTYSCTGGPPFVFDPGSMGNCAVQQIGPPVGLICDVPTTIIIMHDMHEFLADGSRCYSITDDASRPPPGPDLPQAQTHVHGNEPAPYSPATW